LRQFNTWYSTSFEAQTIGSNFVPFGRVGAEISIIDGLSLNIDFKYLFNPPEIMLDFNKGTHSTESGLVASSSTNNAIMTQDVAISAGLVLFH
jgi:hypothetical protein